VTAARRARLGRRCRPLPPNECAVGFAPSRARPLVSANAGGVPSVVGRRRLPRLTVRLARKRACSAQIVRAAARVCAMEMLRTPPLLTRDLLGTLAAPSHGPAYSVLHWNVQERKKVFSRAALVRSVVCHGLSEPVIRCSDDWSQRRASLGVCALPGRFPARAPVRARYSPMPPRPRPPPSVSVSAIVC
jgi:hypothetical protein